MTRRRIEQPAELADKDRPLPPGRLYPAPRSLFEELYQDERTARERLSATVRPVLAAAIAWGVALGYAIGAPALDRAAAGLAVCALTLHLRALVIARRVSGTR